MLIPPTMLSDVEWVKETFPEAIATLGIALKYQEWLWSVGKEVFQDSRETKVEFCLINSPEVISVHAPGDF